MRGYNKIKNFMIASACATLFYQQIVNGVSIQSKIACVLAIMWLVYSLLCDADKHFEKETTIQYLKRRERQRRARKIISDANIKSTFNEGNARADESQS